MKTARLRVHKAQQQPTASLCHAGATIITLIADNHASKLAFKMAKALLRPRDELQLVTVVTNEEGVAYGNSTLAPYLQEQCSNTVTPVVGPQYGQASVIACVQ